MNAPKCPICQQSDVGIVDGQCGVCRSCSKSKRCVFRFCLACQRKWPRNVPTTKSCTLPNCALRAALLSDTTITDPESSARGCPYFRACPQCHALLTHNGEGCPNIICPNCNQEFCFRCLRPECYDNEYYDEYDDCDYDDPEPELCVIVDNTENLQHLGL